MSTCIRCGDELTTAEAMRGLTCVTCRVAKQERVWVQVGTAGSLVTADRAHEVVIALLDRTGKTVGAIHRTSCVLALVDPGTALPKARRCSCEPEFITRDDPADVR